jgi:hypothetical protein
MTLAALTLSLSSPLILDPNGFTALLHTTHSGREAPDTQNLIVPSTYLVIEIRVCSYSARLPSSQIWGWLHDQTGGIKLTRMPEYYAAFCPKPDFFWPRRSQGEMQNDMHELPTIIQRQFREHYGRRSLVKMPPHLFYIRNRPSSK